MAQKSQNIINYVSNIRNGNKALQFIDRRLHDDKYRGSESSQQNRYTITQAVTILTLLNKYASNRNFMSIGNLSTFTRFCNDAKVQAGIGGTTNAMRKNLFPDWHRMGLIERYDKNKSPTPPFSSRGIKIEYVSLTSQGLKLINAKTDRAKRSIFSKSVYKFLKGFIDALKDLLKNNGLGKISIHEFMFFVSAIDTKTSFNINISECVDLIDEYRNLSASTEKIVCY